MKVRATLANRIAVALFALGATLTSAVAAADVIAVVSAKSTVGSLTPNQLADIFLGREPISQWAPRRAH